MVEQLRKAVSDPGVSDEEARNKFWALMSTHGTLDTFCQALQTLTEHRPKLANAVAGECMAAVNASN